MIFFFKSMVWHNNDLDHSTLTVHVNTSMHSLGIWFLSEKLGYQCRLPTRTPTNVIFFFEALAICSVIHLAKHFTRVTCLLIVTNNTNTFDIFASLNADRPYNPILISAINIILRQDGDLHVVYPWTT